MTNQASFMVGFPRELLLSVSGLAMTSALSLALAGPAAAAGDECGSVAAGGTVTCTSTGDPYDGISYNNNKDAVTVVLDGAADKKVVVNSVDRNGVTNITNSTDETRGLAITTTGPVTINTTGHYRTGLFGLHRGMGDVTLTSNADISTDGNYAYGLYGNADKASSAGTVSVSATGGMIKTAGSTAYGLLGLHLGMGDVTLTSNADISTDGNYAYGLYGYTTNASSAGTMSVSATGGMVTTKGDFAYGLYGLHLGIGDVTLTSNADISTGGNSAYGLYGIVNNTSSAGTVSVSATGGMIKTAGSTAYGLLGYQQGMGGVTLTSKADISTGGNSAYGLYGIVNNTSSAGTMSVSATGGTITTKGDFAYGLHGYHRGMGDVSLTSAATVSTEGSTAHGLFVQRETDGLSRIAVTGGTVKTAGDNSDGLRAETLRTDMKVPLGAIADIDVAGTVETTGTGAAGIRVVARDQTEAATVNDGQNASATIDIVSGGRVSSAKAVAITEGAPVLVSGARDLALLADTAAIGRISSAQAVIGDTGPVSAPLSPSVAIDTVLTIAGTVATGVLGGTAVDLSTGNDTLVLQPGATIMGRVLGGDGTDAFVLGGTGIGTFDVSNLDVDGTDDGEQYQGFETFTKDGTSIWTLTGTNAELTKTFTVNDGVLNVNASLPNAVSSVASGATLKGIGTIGSFKAQAGSTVAPGNSIGTLTVAGDATFQKGSVYQVEVAANGDADKIVADTATINGGTVQIIALDPATSYVNGRQSLIIDTTNGRTGQFDSLTDNLNSAFVNFALVYTPNDVVVQANVVAGTGTGTPLIFPAAAITDNQFAASFGLNGLSQTSGSDALLVFNQILSSGTFAEARAAFDLASGEIHASNELALAQDASEFTEFLRRRAGLATGLLATEAPMMAPLSYGEETSGTTSNTFGAPVMGGSMDATTDRTLTAWTGVFGGLDKFDADGSRLGSTGAAKFDTERAGFAVGIEGRFDGVFDTVLSQIGLGALSGGAFTAGLAGGYSSGDADLLSRRSTADIETGHVGYYTASEFGILHLASSGSVSFANVDTTRGIQIGTLNRTAFADYDAVTYASSGEAQLRYELGGLIVAPLVGYDVASVEVDGFTERGAGALNLSAGDDDYTAGDVSVGVAMAKTVSMGSAVATVEARLAYEYGFGDDRPNRRLTLAGAPTTPFTIAGVEPDDDRFAVGLGVSADLNETLTMGVRYDGAFGSKTDSQSGHLTLGFKF